MTSLHTQLFKSKLIHSTFIRDKQTDKPLRLLYRRAVVYCTVYEFFPIETYLCSFTYSLIYTAFIHSIQFVSTATGYTTAESKRDRHMRLGHILLGLPALRSVKIRAVIDLFFRPIFGSEKNLENMLIELICQ